MHDVMYHDYLLIPKTTSTNGIVTDSGSVRSTVASQQEGCGFKSHMVITCRGLFPGLSVWSLHVLPVFTRVPPIEPHNNKNMQKNRCSSVLSLTKTGRGTWLLSNIKGWHVLAYCACITWADVIGSYWHLALGSAFLHRANRIVADYPIHSGLHDTFRFATWRAGERINDIT